MVEFFPNNGNSYCGIGRYRSGRQAAFVCINGVTFEYNQTNQLAYIFTPDCTDKNNLSLRRFDDVN